MGWLHALDQVLSLWKLGTMRLWRLPLRRWQTPS